MRFNNLTHSLFHSFSRSFSLCLFHLFGKSFVIWRYSTSCSDPLHTESKSFFHIIKSASICWNSHGCIQWNMLRLVMICTLLMLNISLRSFSIQCSEHPSRYSRFSFSVQPWFISFYQCERWLQTNKIEPNDNIDITNILIHYQKRKCMHGCICIWWMAVSVKISIKTTCWLTNAPTNPSLTKILINLFENCICVDKNHSLILLIINIANAEKSSEMFQNSMRVPEKIPHPFTME